MGCLKLTYNQAFETPLKVVYRANGAEQKSVQRFLSVDPLSDKYPSHSPYNYTLLNPIRLVDPTGLSAIDYFDLDGNKIGTDGNDADKRNFVITDTKDVRAINKAERNGNHVPLSQLSSAKQNPSKASMRDGLQTLTNTEKVGGDQEYSSTTMADGTTLHGGYGPKIKINYAKGTVTGEATTAKLPAGTTDADVSSLNHSHPTMMITQPNGIQSMAGDALVPSSTDNAGVMNFAGFNIISGPLGPGTRYSDGSFLPPPNGLAIYNGGTFSHMLTKKATTNFINNARW